MDISPYTKYIRSMVDHGERRITEINWLFESVERSLERAEGNFIDEKKSLLTRAGCGGPSCSWLATIVEGANGKTHDEQKPLSSPQLDSIHSVARSTSRRQTLS